MKKLILFLTMLAWFGLSQAQTVTGAVWYNKQSGTMYSGLSYTTTDDSLLTYNVRIQGYDTNFYLVIWVKNNTANDFAAGDSIKVTSSINGAQAVTWKLTLRNGLQKDSTTYFFLNDYVLIKGYNQWGTNNYCYKAVAHNTTPVTDAGGACINFTFKKQATTVTVAAARWYNTSDYSMATQLSYSSADDSLLVKYTENVANLFPNYTTIVWLTNSSGSDLAVGDSILIATYINGRHLTNRRFTLTQPLLKDSTTYYSVNETILYPNWCQWGDNTISFKVVSVNGTPVTDVSTSNTLTITYNKVAAMQGLNVSQVRWYDTQSGSFTTGLSYTSSDDSLLIRNDVQIQSLASNYKSAVWITNNTGANLATGDTIKIAIHQNGANVISWRFVLSKPLPKDSTTAITLNEYLIVPGLTQWGTNSYCYKVIQYNNNIVNDTTTNNCITFTFNKAVSGITVSNVRWYDTQNQTLSTGLTYTSSDDSLLIRNAVQIQSLAPNYKSAVWITNNSGTDLAAGDSIKVAIIHNGSQISLWKITLSRALLKDSTTTITLNEYLIVPGLTQWGTNSYCYKVTQYNTTPITDTTTNNCITFTFKKPVSGLTVTNAGWYDTQNNTVTTGLSYTSSDDSLLTRNVVRIQSLASNYKSAVWITNNTGTDLAVGDSIKVAIKHNGTHLTTWTFTLSNALLKDSTTAITLNEYLIVPGLTQWGSNSYCYEVTQYNTTPITDNPTNNCITFTFNKTVLSDSGITVSNAGWYNKQSKTLTKAQMISTPNESLVIVPATIRSIDTNYLVAVQIKNGSQRDLAAGDSIKVVLKINSVQAHTSTFVLSAALLKDSSTTFLFDEQIIIPGLIHWGENTYCYQVTQHNENPITDNPTDNCMSFTFNKVTPPVTDITVTNAGWYNKTNNTLTKTLTEQSADESLLTNPATIGEIDANYVAAVQIKNGSARDLSIGDSIKVVASLNNSVLNTWTFTLNNALLKDSAVTFFFDEQVIKPSLTQWGSNNYCYKVTYYNETPIVDNPTNNCMTFTFEKTTSIVENALEEVNIYPNPARNILHINNVNNADINIYSITGQRVKTINNVNGNQDIDVSDMASGIYILKMYNGQNTRVEKIQVVK
ncbi:MAG: T9SS type A sorting domain-containing protein [Bacteroidales bacterium]|nr:T9SS type A sorting domain-containing protein [Bacteroidales bacterium]